MSKDWVMNSELFEPELPKVDEIARLADKLAKICDREESEVAICALGFTMCMVAKQCFDDPREAIELINLVNSSTIEVLKTTTKDDAQ